MKWLSDETARVVCALDIVLFVLHVAKLSFADDCVGANNKGIIPGKGL